MSGLTLPVAVYEHSGGDCSVTGGQVHAAKDTVELQGWYFYDDFCSGRVRAFWADDPSLFDAQVVIEDGPPVAGIAQLSSGLLFLSFDGRIYRLEAR